MSDTVQAVTDGEFNAKVIETLMPVVVDFWAAWCGPCRMIAPIIEELASEYDGQVAFYKMDVDVNSATPSQYGIKGIPTVIAFKNGQVVDQIVGAAGKETFQKMIGKALK